MKILFLGDIVGKNGRKAVKKAINELKADVVIVNGENCAGGKGITLPIANELKEFGVNAITTGNHVWARNQEGNIFSYCPEVVRPANFSQKAPGKGSCVIEKDGIKIGIINLSGRVYMAPCDCPFKAADDEILKIKDKTDIIIVDIHGEATSEKIAMAHYLDGKVTAVLGTHTHVQTADETILERGTAYISDVGMTGPCEGVLGIDKDTIIKKFITGMPIRFNLATGKIAYNGVVIEADPKTGKALSIERVKDIVEA